MLLAAMGTHFLDIILGFLEGFSLIISPCILPILPIILAGSLSGTAKKPYGIITGFIIIFSLFAFFARQLVQFSGVDLNSIRYLSYGILIALGVIMLSSYLSEKFNLLTQRLIGKTSGGFALQSKDGFWSGFLFGGLVAFIWTPCAGPILSAIIVQTVLQKTTMLSFFILLAFSLGAALPMLLIAIYGIASMDKFQFFKVHAAFLRKALGGIIIASVLYMVQQEGSTVEDKANQSTIRFTPSLQGGLWRSYPAPEISGIESWINSPPLELKDLKGKVVLVDFWTYSCINCIRALPYIKDWYQKYHDKGLVIIGVHSPEFAFEKNPENVIKAVHRYGLRYPIALDNQFVTWRNFNNHYWPAHYLINQEGRIIYKHFGEGEYWTTENNIRFLLGLSDSHSPTMPMPMPMPKASFDFSLTMTPETYLGYQRAEKNHGLTQIIRNKATHYSFPSQLKQNEWALQGKWTVFPDKIVSADSNSALKIHFKARKVFIVMGNATKPISVKLLYNGHPVVLEQGNDVKNSRIHVKSHKLYEALVLPQSGNGSLELIANTSGLEIYTFTFGK